jgi:type II secretory pathway pseudopilin PulG
MRIKSFTLVEMAIVIMIIGLLAVAITSILVGSQRAWTKQTKEVTLLRDLRWALEYIANDIRMANANATIDPDYSPSGNGVGNGISFTGPYGPVWYWRSPEALGDNIIYRAQGSTANNSVLLKFIAMANPSGVPIFDYDSSNSLVTICMTARSRPSANAAINTGNFTLRTKVRVRNQ